MTLTSLLATMILNTATLTGNDLVELMKSQLSCEWSSKTVDTFKSGDPTEQVKGVAVCFTATMDVLEAAVQKDCNMIITHEPTFYNHLDETEGLEKDPLYQLKQAFIDEHGLMIFRFHDHWHRTSPDGIYVGMVQKFGWEEYMIDGSHRFFDLPMSTVGEVEQALEQTFPGASLRVIGDRDLELGVTAFSAGSPGFRAHHQLLIKEEVKLLVFGEANEWETIEYVRDASQAGLPKAAIILGHVISEEAGMEYCATWLRSFVDQVPVYFIPAGDPFH